MFSIVVRPIQGLLAVDVHVVAIDTPHRTPLSDTCTVNLVVVAIADGKRFIDSQIGVKSEIFQEFSLDITAHVQVVIDRLILIGLQLIKDIVCIGTRSDGIAAQYAASGRIQRRVLYAGTVNNDFVTGFFIEYVITLFVTCIHRSHCRVPVCPQEGVLYGWS